MNSTKHYTTKIAPKFYFKSADIFAISKMYGTS